MKGKLTKNRTLIYSLLTLHPPAFNLTLLPRFFQLCSIFLGTERSKDSYFFPQISLTGLATFRGGNEVEWMPKKWDKRCEKSKGILNNADLVKTLPKRVGIAIAGISQCVRVKATVRIAVLR